MKIVIIQNNKKQTHMSRRKENEKEISENSCCDIRRSNLARRLWGQQWAENISIVPRNRMIRRLQKTLQRREGEIEVWTNLSQEEMNFYVEEFNKSCSGVKVKVTVMPSKEYRTKLQNAFRTGTNAPDVATFEISDLGVYKETDMLENLSQKIWCRRYFKDMIPYVDELSRDKEGDIRGLSWQSTPGGFWYKKALAKEYLGTDDPDELARNVI